MKRNKPLALVAGAALLTLAACGGGGSSDGDSGTGTNREFGAQEGGTKDAEAEAPAPEVEGATEGGTVTVYLPGDPGPGDLDPTNGWSVTGNSIQQALTHRSLTQYMRDPETGDPVLVPDLATDLGTPNEDYTEWTFTIRDNVTWEDGKPITPEEIAFGLCRSLDSEAFPSGPGTKYSKTYFAGGEDYEGPYTGKDPNCDNWDGVRVEGQDVIISMASPFPDMDYWGAFMAMGPAPLGDASNPPNYGNQPLSNGPYKVEQGGFRPNEELVLVKNEQWDPASDPGRHQYADRWVFKFNQDQAKVDQIMLSGNADSQTALTTDIGADKYEQYNTDLGDRLIQQSSQCISMLYPDYTKIEELEVRKALAYAYPYEDAWFAGGQLAGVTRVPANGLMPPGIGGFDPDFQVDGEQITYDPAKAKELLTEAGYGDEPYPITMIYYEVDPLQVDVQEVITKAWNEAGFEVKAIPVQEDPYNIWTDQTNKTNKQLNVLGVNWCTDWPSGSTMLPPLLGTGETYNTGEFSEPDVDARFKEIQALPLEEQAEAWGELNQQVMTDYFPIIPTAFRNDLYAFGEKIGNPTGDGALGAPNYKDLYVSQ